MQIPGKKTILYILWLYCAVSLYLASYFYTETIAHIPPCAEKADLSHLISAGREALTEEDYSFIFEQTGLGKAAVNDLPSLSELEEYQRIYFAPVEYKCKRNSPVSSEEYVTDPQFKLASVEEGDILITRSSHVFSWRNGHAAIVIDAKEGRTLEAVVIGKNSSIQNISKWERYPNIAVLRLKNASAEERRKIAQTAEKYLNDKPYNLIVGLFPQKYSDIETAGATQCAHLVWLAYASAGYDIDSDKGSIVTPKDILESDLFETVQTYGMG